MADLDGAVVIEVTDEDAAKRRASRSSSPRRARHGAPVQERERRRRRPGLLAAAPGAPGAGRPRARRRPRRARVRRAGAPRTALDPSARRSATAAATTRAKDAIDGIAPRVDRRLPGGARAAREAAGATTTRTTPRPSPTWRSSTCVVAGSEKDGDDAAVAVHREDEVSASRRRPAVRATGTRPAAQPWRATCAERAGEDAQLVRRAAARCPCGRRSARAARPRW